VEIEELCDGHVAGVQAQPAAGHTARAAEDRAAVRAGLLYGLAAYGWWGLVPLYFKAVADLPAVEILAQRIVWSVAFLAMVLAWARRWQDVARCFRDRRLLLTLLGSTVLIALNWLAYIYSVTSGQLVQSSLGYFILPLVSIALGMVWFKERLRPLQLAAVAVAAAGVLELTRANGELPWIAMVIAFSFGFYGLLRKRAAVDGLVGLSVEVALLLPVAAGYLCYLGLTGALSLGAQGAATDLLLVLSGVVTAVPLLCFGQAARRLPLSALGFLQYLSPTLALVLGVVLYEEEFGTKEAISFGLIWGALVVYSFDMARTLRRPAPAPVDATG
jgi:chloramphenicol-sensitive protein RarD